MSKQATSLNDAILYSRVMKRTKVAIFKQSEKYGSVADFLNHKFAGVKPPKTAAKVKTAPKKRIKKAPKKVAKRSKKVVKQAKKAQKRAPEKVAKAPKKRAAKKNTTAPVVTQQVASDSATI